MTDWQPNAELLGIAFKENCLLVAVDGRVFRLTDGKWLEVEPTPPKLMPGYEPLQRPQD